MNTIIRFLYRDAANYKLHNECVIKGEITENQISAIAHSLMDGEYFKPSLVGLPAEDFVALGYAPYDDDPDYFELGDSGDLSDSFESTDVPYNVDMTAQQLVEKFLEAKNNGWQDICDQELLMGECSMRIKIFQINSERDKNHIKFERLDLLEKFQGTSDVDSSIYDEVFNADIEETDLEDIYRRFNSEGHPLHRGHSLSISDIVIVGSDAPNLAGRIRFYNSPKAYEECCYTDPDTFRQAILSAQEVGRTIEVDDLQGQNIPFIGEGAYYCDSVGFRKVDFDKSLAHKPDNLMRVVYVEPNRPPFETEIEHTLEAEQKAVGGLIETVYNNQDNTCIVYNDESKFIDMQGNRRIGESSIIAGPFFICGVSEESFRSLTDEEVVKYMDRFKEPENISQDEVDTDMGFTIMTM